MGIIIRQTIKGSIWSYIGVIIGFVTTTYLYTEYLTPDIIGLFSILLAYSNLAGRLSGLGFVGVTNRLFTYFRDHERGHNGFLFIGLVFHIVGFIVFLILYFMFSPAMVASNMDKSPLFASYIYLLIPLTLANLIFIFLDTFNKLLYDVILGTFLQEFLQRVLVFIIVLLFAFQIINLQQLIFGFVCVVSVKAIIIIIYLWKKKELNLRPDSGMLDRRMRKEIINYSLFSLLSGFGPMVVFNIDKILVNHYLDLTSTGVYTIAFYFGSFITMPSRSLLKISGALISDAFKENNIEKIKEIYYKSCLNQLIIGGFLFVGIWSNIDNILIIIGDAYIESKWVIFFIGIGYIIDMATGVNGSIIALSKNYRMNLLFIAIQILLVVSLMSIFVPIWGIVGASIVIAISLLINNVLRFALLYRKFKFQPFNFRHLAIVGIFTFIYIISSLMPRQQVYLDLLIRGSIVVISSIAVFWFLPISTDAKNVLTTGANIIKSKFR